MCIPSADNDQMAADGRRHVEDQADRRSLRTLASVPIVSVDFWPDIRSDDKYLFDDIVNVALQLVIFGSFRDRRGH